MEWQEDGALVLDVKPHGDAHAIVWLLTGGRGLHAGLVRGGQGKRKTALLQTGNRVRADWRSRLEDQLGDYRLELIDAIPARFFEMPPVLACIRSVADILRRTLPERQSYPALYAATQALFSVEVESVWLQAYVRWELGLLAALGFGLDLARCAATGETAELVYVSPKSGRAVSRVAGNPWRERLLPLPSFLVREREQGCSADLLAGLELTGFFLARHVFPDKPPAGTVDNLPFSRHRLLSLIAKEASVAA